MDITTERLRNYESNSSLSSTFSSSENSDTDNDEENFRAFNAKKSKKLKKSKGLGDERSYHCANERKRENIVYKLINREKSGYFTSRIRKQKNDQAYRMVPKRMRFCLNEIVPYCYLKGHVFMGLTVCGQFLLSYKISLNDEGPFTVYNYFNAEARYELYFWIYRPHCLLGKYYRVCLFDDHGVDSYKTVTMVQWIDNPRTLIIHGVSNVDGGNSHITVVAVPKLGCLECKKMRDDYSDDNFRCDALCIKCNLTIHTKYSHTETDPKFIPEINLSLPNYIIMIGNGFIHVISVGLEVPKIMVGGGKFGGTGTSNIEINSYINRNDIIVDDGHGGLAAQVPASPGGCSNGYFGCDKSNLSNGSNLDMVVSNSLVGGCSASNLKKISHIEHHYKSDDINNLIYGCDSHKNNNNSVSGSVHNKNSIVERIIADFAECETDTSSIKSDDTDRITLPKSSESSTNVRLLSQNHTKLLVTKQHPKLNRLSNRIRMSRSLFRHSVFISFASQNDSSLSTSQSSSCVSPQTSSTTSTASSSSKQVYEFSEDTEKCEKISIFRKKRLAEKKYEFSDYNSENIIPFNINLRKRNFNRIAASLSSSQSTASTSSQQASTSSGAVASTTFSPTTLFSSQTTQYPLSYGLFNPAPPNYEVTSHLHRASPSHGFRSPCGSPVGNRCLRSPPGFSKSSYLNSRSPTYYTMRSPTTNSLTLSPRQQPKKASDENFPQHIYQPTDLLNGKLLKTEYCDLPPGLMVATSEHPVCSKKFVRHFVEETDATSVITSEEDDCISPGYHTSLPMEVHGSCYSDMQMVSHASYQRLKCPTVIITQNSFDLETFTCHVVNHLCAQNHKKNHVIYDWACEIIHVCQISNTITLLLMVHFTAIDHLIVESKCVNCSTDYNCLFHRKHYRCKTIYTWNIDSGNWNVIEYGDLNEIPSLGQTNELIRLARRIANELAAKLNECVGNIYKNIRILDSNFQKSKKFIIDKQNGIGFYRKRKNFSQNSDYYLDDSSETPSDSSS